MASNFLFSSSSSRPFYFGLPQAISSLRVSFSPLQDGTEQGSREGQGRAERTFPGPKQRWCHFVPGVDNFACSSVSLASPRISVQCYYYYSLFSVAWAGKLDTTGSSQDAAARSELVMPDMQCIRPGQLSSAQDIDLVLVLTRTSTSTHTSLAP